VTNPDCTECVLEMQAISKTFPGVIALDEVKLSVSRGEIHALMGENGAGKSTLMKILAGVYQKDSGKIMLKGSQVEIKNEFHALQLGIVMVHQELNNFPDMTVAENIFAGREPAGWGIINRDKMNRQAIQILSEFHQHIDPGMKMGRLSISDMQLVEIAKAVSSHADILILDEPTSAISSRDAAYLFSFLQKLREQGVSVIYISHKMEEVFRICDRVTVLRDGKWISTDKAKDIDQGKLIRNMVGRELKELFPARKSLPGEVVLETRHLSRAKAVGDISFTLRKGEILGFAGLVGSGRTEILETLFGCYPAGEGAVYVKGKPVRICSPSEAIQLGIALVPEDRKLAGLNLLSPVLFNLTLPVVGKFAGKLGIIRQKKELSAANDMVRQFRIKTRNLNQIADHLSGGNQQKIVIAKWLLTKPAILLLDEPTRGIDIGAKSEIYLLMNELVHLGISIVMVSSEMPELMGMCDRILAIRTGRISQEFIRKDFDQEKILTAIMPCV
jgi:inositol transport system ATP-binding protein